MCHVASARRMALKLAWCFGGRRGASRLQALEWKERVGKREGEMHVRWGLRAGSKEGSEGAHLHHLKNVVSASLDAALQVWACALKGQLSQVIKSLFPCGDWAVSKGLLL